VQPHGPAGAVRHRGEAIRLQQSAQVEDVGRIAEGLYVPRLGLYAEEHRRVQAQHPEGPLERDVQKLGKRAGVGGEVAYEPHGVQRDLRRLLVHEGPDELGRVVQGAFVQREVGEGEEHMARRPERRRADPGGRAGAWQRAALGREGSRDGVVIADVPLLREDENAAVEGVAGEAESARAEERGRLAEGDRDRRGWDGEGHRGRGINACSIGTPARPHKLARRCGTPMRLTSGRHPPGRCSGWNVGRLPRSVASG